MKIKKMHKAFLVVLLVDTITNVIFAYINGIPVTQKLFIVALIFSILVIFTLKQSDVLVKD